MSKLYAVRISAPCRAVWMLLENSNIAFDMIDVDLAREDNMAAEFVKKNPNHSVPVFEEPDGFILWEAHAILRYIATKHKSPLYPAQLRARSMVHEVMDWHNLWLHPALTKGVFPLVWDMFTFANQDANKELVERGQEQLEECLLYMENRYLSRTNYLMSRNMTIADLVVATSLGILDAIIYDLSEFPKVKRWLEMMKQTKHWGIVHQVFDKWAKSVSAGRQPVNRKSFAFTAGIASPIAAAVAAVPENSADTAGDNNNNNNNNKALSPTSASPNVQKKNLALLKSRGSTNKK